MVNHINDVDDLFKNKVLDYIKRVGQNKIVLTKFLNTTEQLYIENIVNANTLIKVYFNGGYQNSEMKRALFLPVSFQVEESMFHISIFEIEYPKQYVRLTHRNILGTLMSLGFERNNIGDILVDKTPIIIIAKEINEFIQTNFTHINKAPIVLKQLDSLSDLDYEPNYEFKTLLLPSLRLDVIISHSFHLSRTKANELIANAFVKINHLEVDNQAYKCKINDIISVRTKGRIQLVELIGMTKKGKHKLVVGIL